MSVTMETEKWMAYLEEKAVTTEVLQAGLADYSAGLIDFHQLNDVAFDCGLHTLHTYSTKLLIEEL